MAKRNLTYKDAGVDVDANTVWVERIAAAMRSTYGPRVCSRHNAFAGMFRLDVNKAFKKNYRKPVLVACADGVGTKVMLAEAMGDLSTIGIDLVAMNVNDMITCGAEPLFFLDYLGVNKIEPDAMAVLMDGIAEGCRQAGCALLGGETAEMPDVYSRGRLDLAAFAVGVVELDRGIEPERISPGDVVIGLPSSGVHSNGYSLVRKLIRERRLKLDRHYDELGETLGAAVLRPTRIYVKTVLDLLASFRVRHVVRGMAHITGGGLAENVSRVMPKTCDAIIDSTTWTAPPIFDFIQERGVERKEMLRVFNMGIGYVLIVQSKYADSVCGRLKKAGEAPVVIGEVKRGRGRIIVE
jgi:phosphoribosylformylglycinamidine cyclo-ligase